MFRSRIVGALALLAALAGLGLEPALAAVTATPVMAQTPKLGLQQFVQGTDAAGTYKTVYTGGTNGSKVVSLIAASNDGSLAHVLTCSVSRSATVYILGSISIPANAGNGGTPTIDVLAAASLAGLPNDADGNHYLYLQASDLLECAFATALTTTTQITLSAVGADF